jgi:hypothetical protein
VVRYQGRLLQRARQSRHRALAKSRVLVRENEAGEIAIAYGDAWRSLRSPNGRSESNRPAPMCFQLAGDTSLLPQIILGDERTKKCEHLHSL